jgi:hypothetical protein
MPCAPSFAAPQNAAHIHYDPHGKPAPPLPWRPGPAPARRPARRSRSPRWCCSSPPPRPAPSSTWVNSCSCTGVSAPRRPRAAPRPARRAPARSAPGGVGWRGERRPRTRGGAPPRGPRRAARAPMRRAGAARRRGRAGADRRRAWDARRAWARAHVPEALRVTPPPRKPSRLTPRCDPRPLVPTRPPPDQLDRRARHCLHYLRQRRRCAPGGGGEALGSGEGTWRGKPSRAGPEGVDW